MARYRPTAGRFRPYLLAWTIAFGGLVAGFGCRTDPPEPPGDDTSAADASDAADPSDGATDLETDVPTADSDVFEIETDVGSDGDADDAADLDGGDVPETTVASLEILPEGPVTIGEGEQKTLRARTYDDAGGDRPCSSTIQWTKSGAAVAVVARAGNSSRADLTGISLGTSTVTADCGGVTDSVTVEVEATLPDSLQDPTDLSIWLEPEEIVSASGGAGKTTVERWEDSSGNGMDFLGSSNSSNRPVYDSNALGGRGAVRFSGDSRESLNTRNRSSNFVQFTAGTVFFVVRNRNAGHRGQVLSSCSVGNNQIRFDGTDTSLYVYGSSGYRDVAFTALRVPTTRWQILTVELGASEVVVRQNGSRSARTAVANRAGDFEFNQIGSRCSSEALEAELAEVLVYDTRLSSADRDDVERYLSKKYGL